MMILTVVNNGCSYVPIDNNSFYLVSIVIIIIVKVMFMFMLLVIY